MPTFFICVNIIATALLVFLDFRDYRAGCYNPYPFKTPEKGSHSRPFFTVVLVIFILSILFLPPHINRLLVGADLLAISGVISGLNIQCYRELGDKQILWHTGVMVFLTLLLILILF